MSIPEMTPSQFAEKRADAHPPILLDVREAHEHELASLGDTAVQLPLTKLMQQQLQAIPPELADKNAEIVVMCHHGSRSMQVCGFLKANGWQNVTNLQGGIHAYAMEVDRSVGVY